MSGGGTLAVNLELNGDGAFITRITRVDGAVTTTRRSAEQLAASITTLDALLQRIGATPALARMNAQMASSAAGVRDTAAETKRAAAAFADLAKQAEVANEAMRHASTAGIGAGIGAPAVPTPAAATRPAQPAQGDAGASPAAFPSLSGINPLAGLQTGLSGLSGLAGLSPALLGAAGAAGIALEAFHLLSGAMHDAVEDGDRMTASLNQLQAVTGADRQAAAAMYDQITAAAIRTGTATDDLAKTTVQLLTTLGPLGQTPQQVLRIAQTLAELQAVSGTSSAASTRAIREMVEGLAQGQEQLRQLKIIAQDDPALFTALAKAEGTTAGGFEEMGHEGKITSAVMVDLLDKVGTDVDATFAKVPRTLAQSRTSMSDSFSKLRADIDQTFGLSQAMARWDRGLAAMAQSLDGAFDRGITPKLTKARADLQSLLAIKADPQHRTAIGVSEDEGNLDRQIAAQRDYVAALEAKAQAQMHGLDAQAATNKAASEESDAISTATKAMLALGIEHKDAAPLIEKLSEQIAHGHDALIPYNDGTLRASQLLDLLRSKASPAAAAIADLNHQLVEAGAKAQGAFAAARTAALLKADPADTTGQGKNLNDAQRQQIAGKLDQIGAIDGQDAVRQSSRKLQLAQARQKGDHGRTAGLLQAQFDRQDFLREHGTGQAATAEADQVFRNAVSTAQIDAMQKGTGAAHGATNAVTELRAKLAELNASMSGTGTTTAEWAEKLKTASPEIRAQASQIMNLAAQIDATTAANKRFQRSQEAMNSLQEQLTAKTRQADEARADFAQIGRSPIERDVDRSRRQIETLFARIQPDQQAKARPIADQAENQAGLAALRHQVDANQQAAQQITASWAESWQARRAAALAEVQTESDQLTAAIDRYAKDADDRKRLTDASNAYIAARTGEAVRKTESETAKLSRTWGDQFSALDGITASAMGTVTDTMADQLTTGSASWTGFFTGIEKQLIAMELRFAASKLFQMAGLDGGSTTPSSDSTGGALGGILSLAGKGASAVGSFFGLSSTATSSFSVAARPTTTLQYDTLSPIAPVTTPGNHAGGIAGSEATFRRAIDPAHFRTAPRFHTGGMPGLKHDEIATILQKGEGVFTKGQMEAMGMNMRSAQTMDGLYDQVAKGVSQIPAPTQNQAADQAPMTAPKVTMNLHNQTSSDVKAQSSTPKFDGESWVIDTVIKHAQRPGSLRTALGTRG